MTAVSGVYVTEAALNSSVFHTNSHKHDNKLKQNILKYTNFLNSSPSSTFIFIFL